MKRFQLLAVLAIALSISNAHAQHGHHHGHHHHHGSGWMFNFSYGFPGYRPWYPYCYRPYPLYVETPVIVRPAPVIVRPSPIVVQQPAPLASSIVSSSAPPEGIWTATSTSSSLSHPDENVRRDAVMELGRNKIESAVDSLAATLAGDGSAQVRDAAARALGLIASPRALPALTRAAQADSDRDVRRSAQFAVEVIQSQMRR